MDIVNPAYLVPDQLVVARQFEAWIREDFDRAVAAYDALPESLHGKRINSDIVNLLWKPYREGSLDYRWHHSDSVRSTAAAFSIYLLRRAVEKPKGHLVAIFGPPAAGKTSAVTDDTPCDAVFEWTFGNVHSARRMFHDIVDHGHALTVIGVFVDPLVSLDRVVKRVCCDGRAQSIDWIVRSFTKSPAAFLSIKEEMDGAVQWRFIENTLGTRKLHPSLEWIHRYWYTDAHELRERLHHRLFEYRLPAQLYEAMRPYPPGTGGPCD